MNNRSGNQQMRPGVKLEQAEKHNQNRPTKSTITTHRPCQDIWLYDGNNLLLCGISTPKSNL